MDAAGMMDAAWVLRPVSVDAVAGRREDWGEAGVDIGGAGGAGESAVGEADRVVDSAGGVSGIVATERVELMEYHIHYMYVYVYMYTYTSIYIFTKGLLNL